ncbi:putative acetylxylan esterase A [Cytospora mali]|uniref:Carboxylic ester hydrolase n=1 Tax=Cytospora mali TaxID=578113 RepID=A0A194VG90_CYTMA|nr:putative acetylxylan esterase A [Valsa mali var. pyri (nom. inval.)]
MRSWTSVVALLASSARLVKTASLEQLNVSLANNPTNVGFYIYVPDTLAPDPAILVNPHWCHGDAPSAYADSALANLSSQYGFIVIYPDSPNLVDKCWDVSSPETLMHNGGGDSLGIVSMVNWTLDAYKGDRRRVFVTGVSSGAMMSNVLVGAYPDVFAGGSAFAGVAFGCFGEDIPGNASADVDYWNSECASGQIQHSPQEWAEIVRRAYPGYGDRWRPKMQVFHGTVDEVLNYTNFREEIKEWTGVFGLSQIPTATIPNTPVANWTKYVYGQADWFEAYSAWNVTHNIPVQAQEVVDWFDLKSNDTEPDPYYYA